MRTLKATLLLGLLLGTLRGGVTAASSISELEINVTDPRPLVAVADLLEDRYGQAVTYEDPPFIHSTDVRPAGLTSSTGPQPLIPAGTGFAVPYDQVSRALVRPEGSLALLQAAADAHAAAHQPGRFRVATSGELNHLIPTQVKNSSGVLTNLTPVLDTLVRLEPGQRPALEVIEQLATALSARSVPVRLGLFPTQLLRDVQLEVPAVSVSARSHLIALAQASPQPLTWRLFWEPTERYYLLHVMPVASKNQPLRSIAPKTQKLVSDGGP